MHICIFDIYIYMATYIFICNMYIYIYIFTHVTTMGFVNEYIYICIYMCYGQLDKVLPGE